MKETSIKVNTGKEEDEGENYIELPFLNHENDYEKCLNSFSENIPKLVRETPGISTYEVKERELSRMRRYSNMAKDSIIKAFNTALANNLGETIQCLGKSKKVGGGYYEQLTLFP